MVLAPHDPLRADVDELLHLLKAEWPQWQHNLLNSGVLVCLADDADEGKEGDGDGGESDDGKPDADADAGNEGKGDEGKEGKADDGDEPKLPPEPSKNWRETARYHERQSRLARKAADELTKKLKAYEDRDKSEQEKAVDEALARGRTEATTEFEKERQRDRLEVAVTRLAANTGVKLGEGDKAKTVKFADAEIAQMWIERQLTDGTLDRDEMFGSDGKVNQSVLTEALTDLASDKPFLLAQNGATEGRSAVDFDAGKGSRGGKKTVEEMSPEDHYQQLRGKT